MAKVLVSGIQPTGNLHIGNYLGFIKSFVAFQNDMSIARRVLLVADLHSISTGRHEPAQLRLNCLRTLATLLACGNVQFVGRFGEDFAGPTESFARTHRTDVDFGFNYDCDEFDLDVAIQRQIQRVPPRRGPPRFACLSVVTSGRRFDVQSHPCAGGRRPNAAHGACWCPRQTADSFGPLIQTRHLANKFNSRFHCNFFPVPKKVSSVCTRLRSLRNPAVKMSKSDTDAKSRIELTDNAETTAIKIRKAVTDSTSNITFDPVQRPGVSNLVTLFSLFSDLTVDQVVIQSSGIDTLGFKGKLAELINDRLGPIRERFTNFLDNEKELERILEDGEEKGRPIAIETLKEVKRIVGMR